MSCCDSNKDKALFKPARKRWCTDSFFLVLFIVAWGLGISLAVTSIQKDPSLLIDIRYPPDSYGNNCGRPNTPTAHMTKLIYPSLDQDINNQLDIFVTMRYWEFKPTKLCASACPSGFNLGNPVLYGGAGYPCSVDDPSSGELSSGLSCDVPSTYYLYVTEDVIDRCFPIDDSKSAGSRLLCTVPSCQTAPNATLDGSVACTKVDSYPDVTTAWELCAGGVSDTLCQAQKDTCGRIVVEQRVDTFKPLTQTSDSEKYTKDLANYVKTVVGGVESLLVTEASVAIGVFGVAVPVVMAFVWAIFLWFFAGVLVWSLLFAVLALLMTSSLWFCYKAGWFGDLEFVTNLYNSSLTQQAEEDKQTWYGIFAVCTIILFLIAIIFFVTSRKAIKRLIAIIQESTKVFRDLVAIVLWPTFVQLPISIGVYFYGVFISYYIIMVWADTQTMIMFFLAHLLLILWTIQFIKATVWSSMAAAVGSWFTTTNAPEGRRRCPCSIGITELLKATGIIVSKHLGSMAFGSLVIAICQLIRVVLQFIDHHTQKMQDSNMLLKVVMKCSKCVMFCLQKTIEFISYYGFIFVAIHGVGFCRACSQTFVFVAKYMAQTVLNKMVQMLLRVLIGWSTPIACGLATFWILDNLYSYKEFNPMFPALVVLIFSYVVTDGICTVYNCIIDTIYLLSFEDMERPGGPIYLSANLREAFGIDTAAQEVTKDPSKYEAVCSRRGRRDAPSSSAPVKSSSGAISPEMSSA